MLPTIRPFHVPRERPTGAAADGGTRSEAAVATVPADSALKTTETCLAGRISSVDTKVNDRDKVS